MEKSVSVHDIDQHCRRPVLGIAVAALCAGLLTPLTARAGTCAVTSTDDGGAGTLRACLASAADGDTIDATGVSGTILLTSGGFQVTHAVTVNGPGPDQLAVDGNATFRVFEIDAANVSISGLTITNGLGNNVNFTDGGGGIFINNSGGLTLTNCTISANSASGVGSGGGITNYGSLTVGNSTISGNSSPVYDGGGIQNHGTLALSDSTVSGNSAARWGGGIASATGTLTVSFSIVSGNSAPSGGGGIFIDGLFSGTPTINNCTISGNSGYLGGGIDNVHTNGSSLLIVMNSTISNNSFTGSDQLGGGIATNGSGGAIVINSTISGNSGPANAGGGGGIGNSGTLTIVDSTFSDNSATFGGVIVNAGGATLRIGDTILNAGASGGTIFNRGAITSLGYNISSDDGTGVLTATGDQINTDPMLGPLQDNGGPTFTHALLPGSPAIDAGDPSFDPTAFNPPLINDQRGAPFARVVNGRIDIGAFEVQPSVDHFSVAAPAGATAGTPFTFAVTALDANNNVVTGYVGTVHITSTDDAAILPADYTFTAADSGTHAFFATLNTASDQTITATDTSNASGTSNTITVTP